MKQQHNPIQRQSRRKNQRRPSLRRVRLQLEQLEDRTAPSVSVIENFEGSNLSAYSTALRFAPSAVILPIAAHDGLQGLVKQDGYEWMIREDSGSTVHAGDTVSVWTKFAGVADGRAYLGFDSHDIAPAHARLSTGGTLSVVMAANTNELIIQKDAGGNGVASFNTVASVAQTYQADRWYRLEATWGAGGAITGTLYDSDGTTVLKTVSGNTTAPFPSGGGIAFRGFGHDKYFDTVVLDTGSTGSVDERANAGGGLDPNWVPGDPPAPVGNGASGNPAPVPWQYTSTPGSGIEVRLADFNDLQPVAIVGSTVGLAAGNTSYIAGTSQVGWGDPLETPLLAQYIFRQRPDEATQLIGASSTKHFFSSAHSDSQHLNPGESDSYGSGLNTVQDLYTYGSEIDPVTGTLHSPIDRGNLSVDGMVNNGSRNFTSPIDLLLQVSVADLDPAQNPDGTKWYLMGNLFVGGEEDVSQASRWVEIVPHFNGTTFSFSYPDGAGGQLDFRTIPGLVADSGFLVISSSPSGNLIGPVGVVHVVFNRSVDVTTFTPAQVSFLDPHGSPITITEITDVGSTDHSQFDIHFAPQGIAGSYVLNLSSDIKDLFGDPLGHEVVANGGFENPLGSEWTGIGGSVFRDGGASPVHPEVPSHTGSWHLVLGSATSDATITQTLATVPGQSYTFSFWFWSSGGDPTRDFHALWNGTEVYAEINSDAHDYEKHTFTVTATGTSTTIEFLSRNDPAWDGLDDVSVVPIGSIPVGFTITSPAVIATNPEGGPVTAPFNQVRVTFDRPMDPTTVAPANITLTGPGGAIPVTITAVEGTNNTQFDVTFADQNDVGTYTLAISTGVHDSFDNPVTPFARQFVLGELVTNGGFEDPLGSEWTIVDPSGYTARTPDHPHTGNYALQLGAIGADATITQTLATAPGQSYTFSFWYDRDGLTPSDLHVFWNGVDVYDEVNSAPHDYVQHTFTVMATGTSTQIQFRARNDPGYDYLDDVSVIAN